MLCEHHILSQLSSVSAIRSHKPVTKQRVCLSSEKYCGPSGRNQWIRQSSSLRDIVSVLIERRGRAGSTQRLENSSSLTGCCPWKW